MSGWTLTDDNGLPVVVGSRVVDDERPGRVGTVTSLGEWDYDGAPDGFGSRAPQPRVVWDDGEVDHLETDRWEFQMYLYDQQPVRGAMYGASVLQECGPAAG